MNYICSSNPVQQGLVDFDVLGFRLFGDEDVGEDDGENKENDDDNQNLTQPVLGFSHPSDTAKFLFLGAPYFAFRVMVMRHLNNGKWTMDNG